MHVTEINIEIVALLKQLIATPSFSKTEQDSANLIKSFFNNHGIAYAEKGYNIFAKNKDYSIEKPTILLNSHHDTVKPNKGYTLDPFDPIEKEGKLYGLGSNDAGGCLVALMGTFLHFYNRSDLPYNLLFVASAEEEISGRNGIELVLPEIGEIEFGIVGEPTKMNMAVAERGLMVIDATSHGVAGHAARNEGDNAIYHAIEDINWIRNYEFEKISPLLGANKMTVTVIQTDNQQHNVVPHECKFVIDVRVNELYHFDEIIGLLKSNLKSTIAPRSTRLKSTYTPLNHPLVLAGLSMGKRYYGSPTTSDKALMPFCTLKMGPGDSARSHSADEFIYLEEIENGLKDYILFLEKILYA